jgi:uncharacterized membrane protein
MTQTPQPPEPSGYQPPAQQPGSPPAQPGYPAPQPDYGPQPGYPAQQPGYPPQQPGYPPQQPGYPPQQAGYPPQQAGYPAPPPGYGQTSGQYPAAPLTPEADIQQNKVYAILAYLGILVLIPIFAAKESRFARYHANQGLVLMIAEFAYGIAYYIVNAVILASLRGLGIGAIAIAGIISMLLGLVYLVFLVFAILGIINAGKGQFKPLPLIGKIELLK